LGTTVDSLDEIGCQRDGKRGRGGEWGIEVLREGPVKGPKILTETTWLERNKGSQSLDGGFNRREWGKKDTFKPEGGEVTGK